MAENSVIAINRTLGNFTTFTNKSFPLDCDGLSDMQINDALLSILGNLGGNQYILMGCEKASSTDPWSAGYVFTATTAFPAGELLYVESGTQDTIYIQTDTETITASGYDYNAAYSKRYCKHGIGDEHFNISTFTKIETNISLAGKVAQLQTDLASKTPEAVGTIKMWPALTMPSTAWALCDGSSLNKNIYAELFTLIGTTFGGSGDNFNLPDMRSRFPVAYNSGDGDFNYIGKTGGSKQHTLSLDEMPRHSHEINWRKWKTNASQTWTSFNNSGGDPDFSPDSTWIGCQPSGGTLPFTHIQPYFTIPFIIKIK